MKYNNFESFFKLFLLVRIEKKIILESKYIENQRHKLKYMNKLNIFYNLKI